MHENGELWMKNGELRVEKFPMFASSYRKGQEKSKRKLKKGRKRGRDTGEVRNLGRPNGRNAVGEQRKPGVWGKLLQCGGGATEK